MFNYTSRSDLKKETGVDASDFAKKTDLAKSDIKPDIDELKKYQVVLTVWKVT